MFYSLDETASRLTDLCKDMHPQFRGVVTSSQVLQYGMAGHLHICIPLDEDAHAPDWQVEDPDHEYRHDGSQMIARLCGLYLVPPRTLFALELAEHTNLVAVFSLDGNLSFMLGKKIARTNLRVRDMDLLEFFRSLNFPSGNVQPEVKPLMRATAQVMSIRATIAALGYDEGNLPQTAGRPGVKSEVWNKLKEQRQTFVSKDAFDNAWKIFKKSSSGT